MMSWPKRIFFFAVTNLLVILLMSIICAVFDVGSYMTGSGLNVMGLLIFSAIFGFVGAFISLAISKWVAKRGTGARVIENPQNPTEQWLVDTVRRQTEAVGLGMPEVAIFPSPEPNAFATGMSRNNALVAVSEGLLQHMDKTQVEAVLAHEVSHVANGDMITMALMQGVMNTFVIFLSRVIGYAVDRLVLKNERGRGIGFWVTTLVAQVILGILASIVVRWFSRLREYRADAGAARLEGPDAMISALRALQGPSPSELPESIAAFGIRGGGQPSGFMALFMTHPHIEDRIASLERFKQRSA